MSLGLAWTLAAALFGAVAPAAPELEALERAAAAAPDRPGLQVALALACLEAGRPADAERLAHGVLAAWPRSLRARWVLARAAVLRGDRASMETHLAVLEAQGGPAWSEAVQRLRDATRPPEVQPVRSHVRARVTLEYDSGVELLPEDVPAGGATRPNALRTNVAVEASPRAVRGRFRGEARLAADHSTHLSDDKRLAAADRSALAFRLKGAHEGEHVQFGGFGEGGAMLAGRSPRPFLASYGGGAWVGGAPGAFSPWLEGRALRYALSEHATTGSRDLWAFEAAAGAASLLRGQRLAARGVVRLLAPERPEAATDLGADATFAGGLGRFGGHLLFGLFRRTADRGVDGLHGRTEIRGHFALTEVWQLGASAQWRFGDVERGPRVLTGLFVEVQP